MNTTEIIDKRNEIRVRFSNAKKEFAKALLAYEEAIAEISHEASDLSYEAVNNEELERRKLMSIVRMDTELSALSARFNGLKCELC